MSFGCRSSAFGEWPLGNGGVGPVRAPHGFPDVMKQIRGVVRWIFLLGPSERVSLITDGQIRGSFKVLLEAIRSKSGCGKKDSGVMSGPFSDHSGRYFPA